MAIIMVDVSDGYTMEPIVLPLTLAHRIVICIAESASDPAPQRFRLNTLSDGTLYLEKN